MKTQHADNTGCPTKKILKARIRKIYETPKRIRANVSNNEDLWEIVTVAV